MKITVIDFYTADSSPYKDPISIPRGLAALGHEVELVTTGYYDHDSLFGLKVRQLSDWLAHDLKVNRPEVVIAISRFNPGISPVLRAIKAARIPLVVKGDTDGTIGYPIPPNYLRACPVSAHPLNILRHIKWRAPVSYFVKQRLEHVLLADLVVCESPGAAVNLTRVLDFWELPEQMKKITLIPNSISKIYTLPPVVSKKCHTVVSVGRWDDQWSKGADLLAGVISHVAVRKPETEFIVIGKNPEYVSKRLLKSVSSRVWFTGQMDFEETYAIVSSAQICLVPSRLESFSHVAAEALCSGASLVVTPIEALLYLAGGGAYGSIARDFSVSAISAALIYELCLWDSLCREPASIAAHWRAILNEDCIALIWSRIVEQLLTGAVRE